MFVKDSFHRKRSPIGSLLRELARNATEGVCRKVRIVFSANRYDSFHRKRSSIGSLLRELARNATEGVCWKAQLIFSAHRYDSFHRKLPPPSRGRLIITALVPLASRHTRRLSKTFALCVCQKLSRCTFVKNFRAYLKYFMGYVIII